MLILDSNIVYYIHGLSKPPEDISMLKLKTVIQEYRDPIAISSISLWEILLHYRKRAKSIRRLSTFMRCNHICVCNDRYINVPEGEQYNFTQIKQKELEQFISKIMPRKIYVESHFAATVYLLTISAITVFDVFPQTDFANKSIYHLLYTVFSVDRDLSIGFFEEIYANGYKTDDCENYVRNAFQFLLQLTIPSTISLCRKLADITEDEDLKTRMNSLPIEEWRSEARKIERSIRKKISPTTYIAKQALRYGKTINDKQLTDFLNGMWTTISGLRIEYDSLKEYIFTIVKNILLHGSSFWKNDINDALILGSLKDKDLILTRDTGMINHLSTHKQSHSEYEQSLKLIEQIKLT